MECPNCHAQIEGGSNFCPQCGYDLRAGKEKDEEKNAPGRVEKTGQNLHPGEAQKKPAAAFAAPVPFPPAPNEKSVSYKAGQAAKPKGSIPGIYIAGMVVIIIICIIALVLGIVTTVSNAQIAQSASQSLQSSSGSGSSTGTSNSSSSGSSSQTDAQVYLSDAQNCSNVNSANTLNETNADNSYEFSVTGTSGWEGIMTCVAQDLYMPLPIQAKIKNLINEDVTSQITSSTTSTIKWNLQDGSSIFATFSAPLNGNGGWVINFNDVSPAPSSASSSSSSQ
ncbi:MAG: zinc ribbon domain-containing protein [Aeriscardovia sp.]|nr:zinc ribbon domain-containing protein [Aeriscardovia sp.]